MPALETIDIPLGFAAPDFNLLDTVSGETKNLQSLKGEKATVVMFICNHCPFVIHIAEQLSQLANDYTNKGIAFIAISSNDVEKYPADSPEKMTIFAEQYDFSFPYLYDETQAIAKAYKAVCTPDFSIFDANLSCVYRGQLDDSRPGKHTPITGNDIRQALDAILAEKVVSDMQKPSIGCSIKWKGTAPY
ncbi:MAG: thioredoxin family protein [Chitinophagales bacterium]